MMEYLDLIMFAVLFAATLRGYPVAFTIAGVAILFAAIGWASGHFDATLLGALGQRLLGVMTNNVLIAIPLFVFMGLVLEKNGIAEELLETMGRLFGNSPGGLGVSVILVGALLAASTGIVGATVVAMGMIALPTMLRNGYDPRLASGMVCASGTLGQIIPPSTLLIILSDVMSNAYQQAQYSQGKFSIETISVGQIFAAALIPGLALVTIYIIYVLAKAYWSPESAPALKSHMQRPSWAEISTAIFPPVLLIIAVLGSILAGIASPTEAASVGAIGAVFLAGLRLSGDKKSIKLGIISLGMLALIVKLHPIRLQQENASNFDYFLGTISIVLILSAMIAIFTSFSRMIKKDMLTPVMKSTMTITSMIFATMLMASVFSLVFRGLGGDEHVEQLLSVMPGGPTGALFFTMMLIFLLGFFLDFVEISVIVLPIVAPILLQMGYDPVWLSVLIAINLQTSFLTPPFGFSLFYLRAAAPKEVTTGQIYAGAIPFICLGLVAIALIWYFESLATWLPSLLYH